MPNSTSRPFVSPTVSSIAEDDDFLSQHLSNLLIRQPSKATSSSHVSPPSSATRASLSPKSSISRKTSPKQRSASIEETFMAQPMMSSISESDRRRNSDTRSAAQGPFTETCDDLFSSFFVGQSNPSSKRQGPSSEPYGGIFPDKPTFGQSGRRGTPSVSMSTTFGARRRSSMTGTEMAAEESSDGVSVSSSSSMSFGHFQRALHPPGMLGRSSKHYLTNETAITTPPESSEGGISRGGQSESCKALSNSPSSSGQDLATIGLYRRPSSLTVSSETASSQSPSSEEAVTLSQSHLPSTLSTLSDRTLSMVQTDEERSLHFNEGGIIEPPDATTDAPDVSRFDRSAAAPNMTSLTGRHTSMMSRRTRLPRTNVSPCHSSSNDSSNRSIVAPHETRGKMCERSEGSSTASALGNSISNRSIASHDSTAKRPIGLTEQQSITHLRKESLSLVPAGDDGRTFKFVGI